MFSEKHVHTHTHTHRHTHTHTHTHREREREREECVCVEDVWFSTTGCRCPRAKFRRWLLTMAPVCARPDLPVMMHRARCFHPLLAVLVIRESWLAWARR